MSLPIHEPPMQSILAANAAITAKYNSLGGNSGFLGPAVTQIVAAGGFHVDYKGGSIYWSEASGAHAISGDIRTRWLAAGGALGYGYPLTDEASTSDNVCRFNNFTNGGAIYWMAQTGAHLIYGEIYKKWIALGGNWKGHSNVGYPITDEVSTPDNVCRFTNFSNGGAIYWTSAHGAFGIYGAIYQKWMSLGGEQGFLGYPITDESPAGDRGGRYNDFIGGTIYWSPESGAREHQGPLPEFLNFHQDYVFPDGVALGGWSNVSFHSNGDIDFSGHMHDSGAIDYDFSVVWVFSDADTRAYSLTRSDKVAGTFNIGGSRDSDWPPPPSSTNNAAVSRNWRAIVAQMNWNTKASEDWNTDALVKTVSTGLTIAGSIIALF